VAQVSLLRPGFSGSYAKAAMDANKIITTVHTEIDFMERPSLE
jgi:hypothetical protein